MLIFDPPNRARKIRAGKKNAAGGRAAGVEFFTLEDAGGGTPPDSETHLLSGQVTRIRDPGS